MIDVAQSIQKIFEHLQVLGHPVVKRRGPSLNPEFVYAEVRLLGLEPPQDLVRAYSFCDGTESRSGDMLEDIWLFPGYYWMNLKDVKATYLALRDDPRWNRSWLPIFASGGGDFYAVCCGGSDNRQVVGFIVGEEEQFVEFASVAAMFGVINECFKQGAFFIGEHGFQADFVKMSEIAQLMNPEFTEHAAQI